jgi:hypothetical protein
LPIVILTTDFLTQQLAEAEAGWSVGTFGAIAEFARDVSEPVDLRRSRERIVAVTDKGGISIFFDDALRLIASESPTTESWSHRVALCLPRERCAMSGRTELTEVGPDREALRRRDRNGVLFDLGLGALQIDACIRVDDEPTLDALRPWVGKPLLAAGNDAMGIILRANPHRVFISRVGRVEVFQPIPPPDGKSPDGPHTHVLPKLLAHGRTHAATEPLPDGWIPCAHLYPAHPLRDQFGRKRAFRQDHHAAFQVLLECFGLPDLLALKRKVIATVAAGRCPDTICLPDDRFARATVRVAIRQLGALELLHPALGEWLAVNDRRHLIESEDPMEALH